MNLFGRRLNVSVALPAIIIAAWPFAYFIHFVVPAASFSLNIGNDFLLLYYSYKVYLLDLLAGGRFPLWSPSEAGGFPFFSNPFTQSFYPLNLPLALWYRLMGGYSLVDHQVFTVLGVSLYGLGLYLWLCRLVSNNRAVLFAVLVVVSSYRLGEILRFPNAVHAAAWMPWLLYEITLATEKRYRVHAALTLFGSTLMLLTAGYPYYAYYCLFLIPPYIVFMLIPFTRKAFFPDREPEAIDYKSYLLTLGIPLSAGVLFCAPYLWKQQQLLSEVAARPSGDYEYATGISFDPGDTLGSLVFPPVSQVEGWYYFGILGLLLIILFAVSFRAERQRPNLRGRFLVLMFGWFAFISCISYGKHSFLFDLFWNFLPGFTRLRAWGRVNVSLLPILGLCLARAYEYFEACLGSAVPDEERRATLGRMLVVAAIAAAAVALLQVLLDRRELYDTYWILGFETFHGLEYRFHLATGVAFVLLAVVLMIAWKKAVVGSVGQWSILVLMVAASVADLRPVGSHQWGVNPGPGQEERQPLGMARILGESLSVPRCNEYWTISLSPRFNAGYIPYWYFRRYVDFHHRVSEPANIHAITNAEQWPFFQRIMGLTDGERLFVSTRVDHRTIKAFVQDADNTRRVINPEVSVREYDGDRLVVDVQTVMPLCLTFVDNWDPDWRASVNGNPAPLVKVLGTFKSVRLDAGNNRVLFEYCPFSIGKLTCPK